MCRTRPIFRVLSYVIILSLFFLSNCVQREEGWKQFKQPTKTGDVTVLLEKAQSQINEADTQEKVLEFIKTYESVLEIDPYNYEALWRLARWLPFLANAYLDSTEDKKKFYMEARKYSEQAMYTNPEFKNLVDRGAKVWEACTVLSNREMAPMFYWYLAGGSYYMQCLSWPSRLINFRQPLRGKKILARMMEINPTWAGGHPYYAWAVRYSLLPKLMGGDLQKAEEFFDKAIEAGPNWMYIRHSRAKFLHRKKKDREAFKKDLEWLLAQDPHKADSPYPANVWFQAEAREMLAKIDDYFEP